jgi:hypothetical protein
LIVVYGYGLDVDSTSSIVAYGLTASPQTEDQESDAISNASIDEMFVVDYSVGRRRMTRAEYSRWRKLVAMIRAGHMIQKKREKKFNKLEITFERQLLRVAA